MTDDKGSVTLSFDEPGTYYLLTGGSDAFAAAAVKVTVKDGATLRQALRPVQAGWPPRPG